MSIHIAIVGLGYWGPNLARNFSAVKDAKVTVLCDLDQEKAQSIQERFCPDARLTSEIDSLIEDKTLDAVVLATPIRTHFELAHRFLSHGKHVFVEKPLAQTSEECQSLIEIADKNNRTLMVGHVFEFNAAVRWIKNYLDSGELGTLFYAYSQRLNLGRVQNDINVLWSLAPHDISILNYLIGKEPQQISAKGFSYLTPGIEDVVFATLTYPGGIGAHFHVAWMDPRKVRGMTLVGSKTMLVYDDVSSDAKITIYDKGITDLDDFLKSPESFSDFQFRLRAGDMRVPAIRFDEPLFNECQHFIESIQTGTKPLTDGQNGMRVVRVLHACQRSVQQNGASIDIK